MSSEVVLAAFIMAVGLAIAGAGTHLYQGMAKQDAMLRYDGKTFVGAMGNLFVSFVCGPYIMLQMGWRQEPRSGAVSLGSALLSAFIAFGWSFITGLLFLGMYFAVVE
jgi:hypothetical protein